MEQTKIRLLRVLSILRESDEDHPITATQIVHQLSLYGMQAERKAVLRDIAALQDYGYDVLLHEDNKLGYYLASREFEDWELKVIMDAVAGAGFLTSENSGSLCSRIAALASKESQAVLRSATPVFSNVKNGDPTTKNAIDQLLTAIRKKKKVGFRYAFTGNDLEKHLRYDGAEYQISPYALIWRQDRYYLIGNFERYKTLSYYRLDRVRSLRILDEPIVPMEELLGPNADMQMKEYINRNLNNYGGKRTKIRLRVDADMTDLLVDTFGSDFRIEKVIDNTMLVSATVSDGWGLNAWLLQHGDCVQILEPESTRREMIGLLEEIRKKYQNQ